MSYEISAHKGLLIEAEDFLLDDPVFSGGGFLVEAIPFIEAGKYLLSPDGREKDLRALAEAQPGQLRYLADDILFRLPLGPRTEYPSERTRYETRLVAVQHSAFPAYECGALKPGTIYFDVNSMNFKSPLHYAGIPETRDLRKELLLLLSKYNVPYFDETFYHVRAPSSFRNTRLSLDDLGRVADDFVWDTVLGFDDIGEPNVWVRAVSTEWGNILDRSSRMEPGKRYVAFNWERLQPGEPWSDPRDNSLFMDLLHLYMDSFGIPISALFEESCYMGG